MKLFRSLAALGIVLGATAFAATNAEAALILRLTQGGSVVEVEDGGAGDLLPAVDGAILFAGSVGVFNVNVSTGLSDPVLGTPTAPHMDLNSVNNSTAGGTLIIEFFDEDVEGSGLTSYSMHIGGTTSGTVTYQAFADGTLIDTLGPFGGPSFSGDGSGSVLVANSPYTLMQVVTITHTGAGVSSFDAELVAPEPASLALLGLGLVGVGVGARRRRNAA